MIEDLQAIDSINRAQRHVDEFNARKDREHEEKIREIFRKYNIR